MALRNWSGNIEELPYELLSTPINQLPSSRLTQMAMKLNESSPMGIGGWELVAEHLGFSTSSQLEDLKQKAYVERVFPGLLVLQIWSRNPGSTACVLLKALRRALREDLVHLLVTCLEELDSMELAVMLEDEHRNRRLQFVKTRKSATLLESLDNEIPDHYSYEVTGPGPDITWNSKAGELQGRQLSITKLSPSNSEPASNLSIRTGNGLTSCSVVAQASPVESLPLNIPPSVMTTANITFPRKEESTSERSGVQVNNLSAVSNTGQKSKPVPTPHALNLLAAAPPPPPCGLKTTAYPDADDRIRSQSPRLFQEAVSHSRFSAKDTFCLGNLGVPDLPSKESHAGSLTLSKERIQNPASSTFTKSSCDVVCTSSTFTKNSCDVVCTSSTFTKSSCGVVHNIKKSDVTTSPKLVRKLPNEYGETLLKGRVRNEEKHGGSTLHMKNLDYIPLTHPAIKFCNNSPSGSPPTCCTFPVTSTSRTPPSSTCSTLDTFSPFSNDSDSSLSLPSNNEITTSRSDLKDKVSQQKAPHGYVSYQFILEQSQKYKQSQLTASRLSSGNSTSSLQEDDSLCEDMGVDGTDEEMEMPSAQNSSTSVGEGGSNAESVDMSLEPQPQPCTFSCPWGGQEIHSLNFDSAPDLQPYHTNSLDGCMHPFTSQTVVGDSLMPHSYSTPTLPGTPFSSFSLPLGASVCVSTTNATGSVGGAMDISRDASEPDLLSPQGQFHQARCRKPIPQDISFSMFEDSSLSDRSSTDSNDSLDKVVSHMVSDNVLGSRTFPGSSSVSPPATVPAKSRDVTTQESVGGVGPSIPERRPRHRPQVKQRSRLSKPELSSLPGWCPGVTERSINQDMANYSKDDGTFVVWYYSAKQKYVISVSHLGSIRHYAVYEKEMANGETVFYIFPGGYESPSLSGLVNYYQRSRLVGPTTAPLNKYCPRNGHFKFETPEESGRTDQRSKVSMLAHVKLKRPLALGSPGERRQ